MKSLRNWKIWVAIGLMVLLFACAPKRNETAFAKNKAVEAGQTFTEDQLRAAIGSAQYDQLVAGIGADNLNLLTYGVGISNMSQMINGITGPGKLVSLMSNGPNSKKMTSLEVLDLLNKLDDACQQPGSFGTDTIGKMVNMINNVSLSGMEGIKNIVHGVTDTTVQGYSDPNGVTYNNSVSRLALMISLLNEALSVMPTLVNDLAAPRCSLPAYTTSGSCTGAGGVWTPAGVFSALGNAKLIRLVNSTKDMRDLGVIINGTTSLSNITAVMAGLNGNVYCSKPQYTTYSTCNSNGGAWTNTMCTAGGPTFPHTTRVACEGAGGTWTPDGIENMARIINELDRVCANVAHTNGTACIAAGSTWRTKASKIPVIVNNISNVPNMYTIVNGLSNDGKRPAWPTVALPVGLGLPTAYPGDAGNVFDGVDSMVATLNKLYVGSMGDADSFGTNGTFRLAYMVNNLDTTPVYGNDSTFDTGTNCANGQFDNRLNWAFSNNQTVTAAPWWGGSFASGGGTVGTHFQAGTCGLKNDNTAATAFTQTQSAELVANITTAGTMSFQYRFALNAGDVVRFLVDDGVVNTYTNANNSGAFANQNYAATTGVHRFRWDIHRALNSNGQMFLDTVTLPGDKGAMRTAAEKTYIMMNNLYIASSITNVADILRSVGAPACVATPLSCTPTWNNGLDTLIHIVNRVEYPMSLATPPRLATTVNTISNLQIMYDVLDRMPNQAATDQLIALMDFVQTPANVPTLINLLTGVAGERVGDLLKTLTAAGTANMLRVMADTPTGAPVSDVATLVNGVPLTERVAEILNKLKLSANVYSTTTSTVTFTLASPTVVTWTAGNHGLVQNARISFTSTIKLPTGVNSGQVYYVCPINATTFYIADDLACVTKRGATALNSGTHTALAGDETFFNSPNPGGGAKLAQFFNRVNTVKTANGQNCVAASPDNFCIQNHLVRLVNDIATSSAGSNTVAEIVSNLRPSVGPGVTGAYPGGATGVERMVDVLFDMRATNTVTPYADPLSNSTAEDFGRLTTFIKDMTGSYAGLNTARMVNEVNLNYMGTRVTYLLRNINRIKYLSRMLSEMTSVDLMLQLLNDTATNIAKIETLVDTHGDLTYPAGVYAGTPGTFYKDAPSGFGCATSDCDTYTPDKLGRLIQLINNIDAIGNTLSLINNVQDIGYVSYLVNNMTRIVYLSHIVNKLENVDLMVKVLNGSDACSVYVAGVNDVTDTAATCATAGGTWFGVGRCTTAPAQTLRGAVSPASGCLGAGGTWEGADRVKLRDLLNGLGDSRMRGGVDNTKNIGDMLTLYDVMNKLGYNVGTARTAGQQVRVVRTINAIAYCGLKPAYDKYIQYGPTCVDGSGVVANLAYQFPEACAAAGLNWRAKYSGNVAAGLAGWNKVTDSQPSGTAPGLYFPCDKTTYTKPTATLTSGGYYNNNDIYDGRPRILNTMLQVNDGTAFSYIVGDVQNTQKTIDMENGTRRIRAVTQLVNWMPGPVTAALMNATHTAAVNRALVYMANNLDDDEDEIAKAFASMIHFGTKMVPQGAESGAPACLEFTGLGPRRLAAVMNLEAGPYLEGLISNLGWQPSIAAMNCGWARDDGQNPAKAECTAFGSTDGAVGGMWKAVGGSYAGNPAPTAKQCVPARELTAGYRYGNYPWGTNQGIRDANCRSIMPNLSGGSVLGITEEDNTDNIIWNGMSTTVGDLDRGIGSDNCDGSGGCSDMWGLLKGKGSGALGWIMGKSNSYVGFPSPSNSTIGGNRPDGSSAGTLCSSNNNNSNNWQCVRCALQRGDLGSTLDCSSGDSAGTSTYGRYYGTFCSGGATTTGGGSTDAQRCISNGGTWKVAKKFESASCKLNPAVDAKLGP